MQDILNDCTSLDETRFEDGQTLFVEGERANRLVILIEGTVTVEKGATEVARVSDPGAIFGEISALLGIEVSATVTAKGPVRAYLAEPADAFIDANPRVAVHTARVLAGRLYDATSYLSDLKRQFEDQAGHFGMMDTILEALLQQQGKSVATPTRDADDPRL